LKNEFYLDVDSAEIGRWTETYVGVPFPWSIPADSFAAFIDDWSYNYYTVNARFNFPEDKPEEPNQPPEESESETEEEPLDPETEGP